MPTGRLDSDATEISLQLSKATSGWHPSCPPCNRYAARLGQAFSSTFDALPCFEYVAPPQPLPLPVLEEAEGAQEVAGGQGPPPQQMPHKGEAPEDHEESAPGSHQASLSPGMAEEARAKSEGQQAGSAMHEVEEDQGAPGEVAVVAEGGAADQWASGSTSVLETLQAPGEVGAMAEGSGDAASRLGGGGEAGPQQQAEEGGAKQQVEGQGEGEGEGKRGGVQESTARHVGDGQEPRSGAGPEGEDLPLPPTPQTPSIDPEIARYLGEWSEWGAWLPCSHHCRQLLPSVLALQGSCCAEPS